MFSWCGAIGSAPCSLSLQRFQHPSGGATRQTSTGPPFLHDWPADVYSLPPLLLGHPRAFVILLRSADTSRIRIVTKCPILYSRRALRLLYRVFQGLGWSKSFHATSVWQNEKVSLYTMGGIIWIFVHTRVICIYHLLALQLSE